MNRIVLISLIAFGLGLGGCGSDSAVTDYLIGDGETPNTTTPHLTQKSGLQQAPNINTYTYTPTQPRVTKTSSLSKPPKNSQRVYVTVNDKPITGYDIAQRMRLNKVLQRGATTRKKVLDELINESIQISEAEKNKVRITDRQVAATLKRMNGNLKGKNRIKEVLARRGISIKALERQIRGNLALRWLMQRHGATVAKVDDAAIDAQMRKFNSDPRRQSVTVYLLRQVNLPVENPNSVMGQQLLQARAVEAQQIGARYRGCRSLRTASSGIYNVQLSGTIQADGRKLPAQMRKALHSAGTRKLIGPMRNARGIQMIAFCGTRRVDPPKATRAQVRNFIQAKNFEKAAEKIMRDLRRKAFIDYKVRS